MDTKELIVSTLKDSKEPLKAGEIAEITGLEKADVDKAIKELKKEERITSPKRCYYHVTTE